MTINLILMLLINNLNMFEVHHFWIVKSNEIIQNDEVNSIGEVDIVKILMAIFRLYLIPLPNHKNQKF
jgi:hypothetical protein